jgi:imidazole glycerol-phosphate synthase subunit HisH
LKKPRIGVLSLGASNAANVSTGLRRAGGDPFAIRNARDLESAHALVIPGVANVEFLIEAMVAAALRSALVSAIRAGIPTLGICAGFQLCFDSTDEAPQERGLGVFPGSVRGLAARKLPHIGWNWVDSNVPVMPSGWAYFAHSFAAPASVRDAIAVTDHDGPFASAALSANVLGVQFHPERSGAYGAAVLQSFVRGIEAW